MESDLKLTSYKGYDVVDSRIVSGELGIEHRALIQGIRKYQDQIEHNFKRVAFEMIPLETSGGIQQATVAFLTEDQALFIATLSKNSDKVVSFKARLVKAFQAMRNSGYVPEHSIPKSFAEALMLAATQAKQIEEQQAQIESDKPKVVFANAVSASDSCILIGDLAKLLKQNGINIGQNRLFEWMRSNSYLISRASTSFNMPTQRSMDLKLFEIKETIIISSSGKSKINKTPRVTGKGQTYFIEKFIGKEI